jgi:hypothetical protein
VVERRNLGEAPTFSCSLQIGLTCWGFDRNLSLKRRGRAGRRAGAEPPAIHSVEHPWAARRRWQGRRNDAPIVPCHSPISANSPLAAAPRQIESLSAVAQGDRASPGLGIA